MPYSWFCVVFEPTQIEFEIVKGGLNICDSILDTCNTESEYAALLEYDKEWVKMFINRPADEPLKPHQAKFFVLFGNPSVTRTAMLALISKPASRAAIISHVNTVISRDDWIAARDS